jgi:alkylhydroperoxidase family enzyme
VPDAVWEGVARFFDKNEIVRLLMAICAINVWNRMAISTHQALPGRDDGVADAQSST